MNGQGRKCGRRTGGKAKVILIEAAAEAIGFFLKGIAIILLIAAAGLVFIILREVAWYVRKQNEKKMEEKDNAGGNI